jgi:hypothetical protein
MGRFADWKETLMYKELSTNEWFSKWMFRIGFLVVY